MAAARAPAVAGLFYPDRGDACRRDIARCVDAASPSPIAPGVEVLAAAAPHAGWAFSGPTMAAALLPLCSADPETVVVFGADHHGIRPGRASVHPGDAWETPLGPVEVDAELARALAADAAAGADLDASAHGPEHSIEVLVPFLLERLPRARLLPVVVPPGPSASDTGAAAARAARRLGRRVVAVGSSDLTHYGARYGFLPRGTGAEAHRWSCEENDRAVLDPLLALDAAGIVPAARRCHAACGPGALAAVAAFAVEAGAGEARLLRHTTSAVVLGEEQPEMWVGYAAVVFIRKSK